MPPCLSGMNPRKTAGAEAAPGWCRQSAGSFRTFCVQEPRVPAALTNALMLGCEYQLPTGTPHRPGRSLSAENVTVAHLPPEPRLSF